MNSPQMSSFFEDCKEINSSELQVQSLCKFFEKIQVQGFQKPHYVQLQQIFKRLQSHSGVLLVDEFVGKLAKTYDKLVTEDYTRLEVLSSIRQLLFLIEDLSEHPEGKALCGKHFIRRLVALAPAKVSSLKLKRAAVETLCALITRSPANQQALVANYPGCYKLFKVFLPRCGDFQLQASASEILYRLTRKHPELLDLIDDNAAKRAMVSIHEREKPDVISEIRNFVGLVNASMGASRSVYSFLALKIAINGRIEPLHEQKWVHVGADHISFYATSADLSPNTDQGADGDVQIIDLYFNDIKEIKRCSSSRLEIVICKRHDNCASLRRTELQFAFASEDLSFVYEYVTTKISLLNAKEPKFCGQSPAASGLSLYSRGKTSIGIYVPLPKLADLSITQAPDTASVQHDRRELAGFPDDAESPLSKDGGKDQDIFANKALETPSNHNGDTASLKMPPKLPMIGLTDSENKNTNQLGCKLRSAFKNQVGSIQDTTVGVLQQNEDFEEDLIVLENQRVGEMEKHAGTFSPCELDNNAVSPIVVPKEKFNLTTSDTQRVGLQKASTPRHKRCMTDTGSTKNTEHAAGFPSSNVKPEGAGFLDDALTKACGKDQDICTSKTPSQHNTGLKMPPKFPVLGLVEKNTESAKKNGNQLACKLRSVFKSQGACMKDINAKKDAIQETPVDALHQNENEAELTLPKNKAPGELEKHPGTFSPCELENLVVSPTISPKEKRFSFNLTTSDTERVELQKASRSRRRRCVRDNGPTKNCEHPAGLPAELPLTKDGRKNQDICTSKALETPSKHKENTAGLKMPPQLPVLGLIEKNSESESKNANQLGSKLRSILKNQTGYMKEINAKKEAIQETAVVSLQSFEADLTLLKNKTPGEMQKHAGTFSPCELENNAKLVVSPTMEKRFSCNLTTSDTEGVELQKASRPRRRRCITDNGPTENSEHQGAGFLDDVESPLTKDGGKNQGKTPFKHNEGTASLKMPPKLPALGLIAKSTESENQFANQLGCKLMRSVPKNQIGYMNAKNQEAAVGALQQNENFEADLTLLSNNALGEMEKDAGTFKLPSPCELEDNAKLLVSPITTPNEKRFSFNLATSDSEAVELQKASRPRRRRYITDNGPTQNREHPAFSGVKPQRACLDDAESSTPSKITKHGFSLTSVKRRRLTNVHSFLDDSEFPRSNENTKDDDGEDTSTETVFLLFANLLKKFKQKLQSQIRDKNVQILNSTSEKIISEARAVEVQIQKDVDDYVQQCKQRLGQIETQLQDENTNFKGICERFDYEFNKHVQLLDEMEVQTESAEAELKALSDKQKLAHRKLIAQTQKTSEEHLAEAERKLLAVKKAAKRMQGLREVLQQLIMEGDA